MIVCLCCSYDSEVGEELLRGCCNAPSPEGWNKGVIMVLRGICSGAGPSEAAEAPALNAEEAPGLDASGTKSLIARSRAAARKHLQALKHRQTILQALDISIPAPAPGPISGQVHPHSLDVQSALLPFSVAHL